MPTQRVNEYHSGWITRRDLEVERLDPRLRDVDIAVNGSTDALETRERDSRDGRRTRGMQGDRWYALVGRGKKERAGGKRDERDPRQRQHTAATVSLLHRIRRVARRYHDPRLIIII